MTLPLFPLNLVLFPTVQIPLHIFEPRYRQLMGQCLDTGCEFGINLVEEGHLHPVGCAAKLVVVTQQYPDGRLDVVVEGTRRYRLLDIREAEQAYAVGETETIEDEDLPVDDMLVEACAGLYNQIIELVYGATGPRYTHSRLSAVPSFYMAPKSGLATDQKQHLLELGSENSRLEFLMEHLQEIVPNIRKADQIQRIIQSDGYFPPRPE